MVDSHCVPSIMEAEPPHGSERLVQQLRLRAGQLHH